MASLLAWRRTCRDAYLLATKELRRALHSLLARFIPRPVAFLRHLTRWGALVIGAAALSHILLDFSLCETNLELAVGNLVYEPFIRSLVRLLSVDTGNVAYVDEPTPPPFPVLRHITRIARFYLSSGRIITVYESTTGAACGVVCGEWTSALMNFVTESTLGCAYPRLTLNYRGIICDGRTHVRLGIDDATYGRLIAKGFELSPYSSAWASFSTGPYSVSVPSVGGCGKMLHVCPFHGRFFGDPGSLVIFFNGFFVDLDTLRDTCVAPYGLMMAWRIPTKGNCEGRCVEDESTLPALVTSILFRFTEERPVFNRPSVESRMIRRTVPALPSQRYGSLRLYRTLSL